MNKYNFLEGQILQPILQVLEQAFPKLFENSQHFEEEKYEEAKSLSNNITLYLDKDFTNRLTTSLGYIFFIGIPGISKEAMNSSGKGLLEIVEVTSKRIEINLHLKNNLEGDLREVRDIFLPTLKDSWKSESTDFIKDFCPEKITLHISRSSFPLIDLQNLSLSIKNGILYLLFPIEQKQEARTRITIV